MDKNVQILNALKQILGQPDYNDFLNTDPTWEQVRDRWNLERERIARHNKSAQPRITTGMLTWPKN